jgi:hypothetical protein
MNSQNFMAMMGAVIIILVVAYFGFQAIDSLGLEPQKASAVVVEKNYHAADKTYTTQYINKRTQVIPQITPEVYLLLLEIDGEKSEGAVPKEIYDAVRISQRVEVTFERRRLTGSLVVIEVKL